MKKFHALFLFIFFPLFSFDHFQQFTHQWISSYIINQENQLKISDHDYQALVNLLFYSHARSAQTLASQQIAFDSLQTTWKVWANICANRLNPTKQKPFKLYHEPVENVAQLSDALQQHAIANENYHEIITKVITENQPQQTITKEAIAEVRSTARKIISDALLDVKQHVNFLIENSKKSFRKYNKQTSEKEMTRFLDTIWQTLTLFGIQSFIEADELSGKVSNDAWEALMQVQQASLYVWKTIESSRAGFYKDLYNQLRDAFPEIIVISLIEKGKVLPMQIDT